MPSPPSIVDREDRQCRARAASSAPVGTTSRSPAAGERRDREPRRDRRQHHPGDARQQQAERDRRAQRHGARVEAAARLRPSAGASSACTCSGSSPVGQDRAGRGGRPAPARRSRRRPSTSESGEGRDDRRRRALRQQRDAARDRVVRVEVDVEAAGQDDDHERGCERVLEQADRAAHEHLPRELRRRAPAARPAAARSAPA